ncbi:MAG: DnaK suppressor protein [Parcubacteria group bacterium GW2011_GWF2_39_13b]|nr:MAG: DnaK suppressor protein [Parcubacteria group bacterium GW2011_GWF2_39_13b]
MEKQTIEKFKYLLEQEKKEIESQLEGFTKKDAHIKDDYDANFPDLGTHQSTDEMAQEVSMYEAALPLERALEKKLQDINAALSKIENNQYGICENCGEEIPIERLETKPEAKNCVKCKAKK